MMSVIKVKAPLAIETRDADVSALEALQKFRIARMCNRPTAAAGKEAVLVRKICHQLRGHDAMKGYGSATPGIKEQMIKYVLHQFALAADLHNLTDSAGLQVVKITAHNLLVFVAQSDFPEVGAGMHPFHESEKPFQGATIVIRP